MSELCPEQFGAFVAQVLSDRSGVFFLQGLVLKVGDDLAPLLASGKVTVVAADQFFEDATFEFVPGRAVAAIEVAIGYVVLVVGVIVDAGIKGLEVAAYHLLHARRVQRTGVEAERTDEVD